MSANFDSRNLLVYLSLHFNGNWDLIYKAIENKEYFDYEGEEIKLPLNCHVLTILDDEYPLYLKKIHRPPFVLFYYGDITLLENYENHVAIIGSREPSPYGIEATEKIVGELKREDIIISGLAKGIDSIGQRKALKTHHRCISVLGCGVDYCYPIENLDLYEKIKKDHLLLSEYPLATPPQPEYFLARNRIIAGLAQSIVVTEAKIHSGTMSTVAYGLEGGKDIYCVPNLITIDSGTNILIQEGATLIISGKDVDSKI